MTKLTGKIIREKYVLERKVVPENIKMDDNREYDIETYSDLNSDTWVTIHCDGNQIYKCLIEIRGREKNLGSN